MIAPDKQYDMSWSTNITCPNPVYLDRDHQQIYTTNDKIMYIEKNHIEIWLIDYIINIKTWY